MAGGALTVLHTSDLQCGAPFLHTAAEALVRLARRISPDVVVCSGDLTQRAKGREFRTARELLTRLGPAPTIVTPGNHDVPLYRVWERLASPYRKWRRFAGPALDTATRVDGATFVALDSAAPRRRIVNGRLREEQIAFARRSFATAPAGDLRIVVTHHHLVPVPGGEGSPPLPGATKHVRAFEEMGVDVVLGGHVHQLHLRTSADVEGALLAASAAVHAPGDVPSRVLPILACGTTTSKRGRGPEVGWNSLCVLEFEEARVRVTPYLRAPGAPDFESIDPIDFGPLACGRRRMALPEEAR